MEKVNDQPIWEVEADVNKAHLASVSSILFCHDVKFYFFLQNHLICTVPPYSNPNIQTPVKVQIQLVTQYKEQLS